VARLDLVTDRPDATAPIDGEPDAIYAEGG
jgi:hypothetical protein